MENQKAQRPDSGTDKSFQQHDRRVKGKSIGSKVKQAIGGHVPAPSVTEQDSRYSTRSLFDPSQKKAIAIKAREPSATVGAPARIAARQPAVGAGNGPTGGQIQPVKRVPAAHAHVAAPPIVPRAPVANPSAPWGRCPEAPLLRSILASCSLPCNPVPPAPTGEGEDVQLPRAPSMHQLIQLSEEWRAGFKIAASVVSTGSVPAESTPQYAATGLDARDVREVKGRGKAKFVDECLPSHVTKQRTVVSVADAKPASRAAVLAAPAARSSLRTGLVVACASMLLHSLKAGKEGGQARERAVSVEAVDRLAARLSSLVIEEVTGVFEGLKVARSLLARTVAEKKAAQVTQAAEAERKAAALAAQEIAALSVMAGPGASSESAKRQAEEPKRMILLRRPQAAEPAQVPQSAESAPEAAPSPSPEAATEAASAEACACADRWQALVESLIAAMSGGMGGGGVRDRNAEENIHKAALSTLLITSVAILNLRTEGDYALRSNPTRETALRASQSAMCRLLAASALLPSPRAALQATSVGLHLHYAYASLLLDPQGAGDASGSWAHPRLPCLVMPATLCLMAFTGQLRHQLCGKAGTEVVGGISVLRPLPCYAVSSVTGLDSRASTFLSGPLQATLDRLGEILRRNEAVWEHAQSQELPASAVQGAAQSILPISEHSLLAALFDGADGVQSRADAILSSGLGLDARLPAFRVLLRVVSAVLQGSVLPGLRVSLASAKGVSGDKVALSLGASPSTTLGHAVAHQGAQLDAAQADARQRTHSILSSALESLQASVTIALMHSDSVLRRTAGHLASGMESTEGGNAGFGKAAVPELFTSLLRCMLMIGELADVLLVLLPRVRACAASAAAADIAASAAVTEPEAEKRAPATTVAHAPTAHLLTPILGAVQLGLRSCTGLLLGLCSTVLRHHGSAFAGDEGGPLSRAWVLPALAAVRWLVSRGTAVPLASLVGPSALASFLRQLASSLNGGPLAATPPSARIEHSAPTPAPWPIMQAVLGLHLPALPEGRVGGEAEAQELCALAMRLSTMGLEAQSSVAGGRGADKPHASPSPSPSPPLPRLYFGRPSPAPLGGEVGSPCWLVELPRSLVPQHAAPVVTGLKVPPPTGVEAPCRTGRRCGVCRTARAQGAGAEGDTCTFCGTLVTEVAGAGTDGSGRGSEDGASVATHEQVEDEEDEGVGVGVGAQDDGAALPPPLVYKPSWELTTAEHKALWSTARAAVGTGGLEGVVPEEVHLPVLPHGAKGKEAGQGGRRVQGQGAAHAHRPSTLADAILAALPVTSTGLTPKPPQLSGVATPPPYVAKPAFSKAKIVVIDALNVAMRAGDGKTFVAAGIARAAAYWQRKGLRVLAFLPDSLVDESKVAGMRKAKAAGQTVPATRLPDNLPLLQELRAKNVLVPTPAQDYDDSYTLRYAQTHPGTYITSNDRYRDWVMKLPESHRPAGAAWLKSHVVSFLFVGASHEGSAGLEFLPNPDFNFPECDPDYRTFVRDYMVHVEGYAAPTAPPPAPAPVPVPAAGMGAAVLDRPHLLQRERWREVGGGVHESGPPMPTLLPTGQGAGMGMGGMSAADISQIASAAAAAAMAAMQGGTMGMGMGVDMGMGGLLGTSLGLGHTATEMGRDDQSPRLGLGLGLGPTSSTQYHAALQLQQQQTAAAQAFMLQSVYAHTLAAAAAQAQAQTVQSSAHGVGNSGETLWPSHGMGMNLPLYSFMGMAMSQGMGGSGGYGGGYSGTEHQQGAPYGLMPNPSGGPPLGAPVWPMMQGQGMGAGFIHGTQGYSPVPPPVPLPWSGTGQLGLSSAAEPWTMRGPMARSGTYPTATHTSHIGPMTSQASAPSVPGAIGQGPQGTQIMATTAGRGAGGRGGGVPGLDPRLLSDVFALALADDDEDDEEDGEGMRGTVAQGPTQAEGQQSSLILEQRLAAMTSIWNPA